MNLKRWLLVGLGLLVLIPVVVAAYVFLQIRAWTTCPQGGMGPGCIRGYAQITNVTGGPVSVRVQDPQSETPLVITIRPHDPYEARVGLGGCMAGVVEVLAPDGETVALFDPPCEGEGLQITVEHIRRR